MPDQEIDPLAKYRVQVDDPLAKYRVKVNEPIKTNEPIKLEAAKPDPVKSVDLPSAKTSKENSDTGIFSKLFHSFAPDYDTINRDIFGNKRPEPDTYLGGFGRSLSRTAYDEIVKPTLSTGGLALTFAGGPILRGIGKIASKLPGAEAVSNIMNKPIFGTGSKQAVAEILPVAKSTSKDIAPKVGDSTVENLANQIVNRPEPEQKLLAAIKSAKPLNNEQAKIYTAERAAKMEGVRGVNTTGQAGFLERKAELAGEHTKIVREPLKLEQPDIDALYDKINNHFYDEYQSINAGDGLAKILAGKIPQRNELILLSKVFGPDIKQLPSNGTGVSLARMGADVSRAMNTIHDLSMPFRQAFGAIHDSAWWKSWGTLVKSFSSQDAADGAWQSVVANKYMQPSFVDGKKVDPLFRRIGLRLIDPNNTAGLGEARGSQWVEEHIPGAKASNRSAASYLNKLRTDMTSKLLDQVKAAGVDIEGKDIDFARKIADYVNNATGSGTNKYLEKRAQILNDMMFSPRLQYSRFHMLNPYHYLTLNTPEGKFLAKQYWKSAVGMSGAWMSILKGLELSGWQVNWTDPTRSDFLRARKDNLKFDPGAGFAPILTLMGKIVSDSYTALSGKKHQFGVGYGNDTMLNALKDFVGNKLAPVPKYGWDALDAKDKFQFNATDRAMRLVVPMMWQDLSDVLQENPKLLWILPGAATGMGIQNQEDKDFFGDIQKPLDMKFPNKPIRRR